MKSYERVASTKDRLKETMRLRGKTQADLVRDTGLNRGTISRYLSGEVEPRQDAAYKLANALNVSVTWLWGYDVPMEKTEMQKKNDAIADIVMKLRKDDELLSMMEKISKLDDAKRQAINSVLNTYEATEK